MADKIRTFINGVTLNTPTYKNVSFSPSLINFFYGKNGTGKSTVASCIRDGKAGISWEAGCDPSTRILVYNEDFIEENIQSYGNIPGVFTISEADANARKELDEAIARKKDVDGLVSEGSKTLDEIAKSMDDLEGNYATKLWKMTEELRKSFPSAMTGFLGSKKKFFQNLLKYNAVEHDLEDLRTFYTTVFGKQHPRYQPYSSFDYKTALPFSELISKPIISRSDTKFAKFIQALGNLDWVRRGHDAYAHSAGDKCPYCQQILPPTFETDLASCYDAQYKQELEELKQFVAAYKNAANQIYRLVTENLKNPFPTPSHLAEAYKYEFDMFMAKATNNVSLLEKKLAEPSAEIWEFEDLSPYLHKLSDATDSINQEIMAYMDLLKDIPGKQRECTDMVWELLAHTCAGAIAPYGAEKENCLKKRQDLMGKLDKYQKDQLSLQKAITVLNNKTVNTTKVMADINHALLSAGFRGFYLREKPSAKYVYELVRDDADGRGTSIAKGLSEGERHFIAFLYFYHLVMGSQKDTGETENKIVIIDDPVSSMDSSSLFVVASLVREMIAVCYNNYEMDPDKGQDDHIRQFFCLTHNPFFFREITYNRLADYECVSFFEIKKDRNNHSSITECVEDRKTAGGGKMNSSPVKNNYDSLWYDYRTTDSPVTLMNVARQILEYYFIQMCGYKSGSLRSQLLEENEYRFVSSNPDGTQNRQNYIAAAAMIALLNVGATGFNDGLYFDSTSYDMEQLRGVFREIFQATNQEGHYNMMMGE